MALVEIYIFGNTFHYLSPQAGAGMRRKLRSTFLLSDPSTFSSPEPTILLVFRPLVKENEALGTRLTPQYQHGASPTTPRNPRLLKHL